MPPRHLFCTNHNSPCGTLPLVPLGYPLSPVQISVSNPFGAPYLSHPLPSAWAISPHLLLWGLAPILPAVSLCELLTFLRAPPLPCIPLVAPDAGILPFSRYSAPIWSLFLVPTPRNPPSFFFQSWRSVRSGLFSEFKFSLPHHTPSFSPFPPPPRNSPPPPH